jgi:hypothetical protein
MKSDATTCESRDILSSRWLVFMLYWLPAIAIVVAGAPAISNGWRTAVWTVALCIMGAACTVNAVRCGRVHCYVTGPFFLLMALVALSYGLGILHLGRNGWNLLGLMALIGAIALWCLPEMLLGKYRKGRADRGNAR